MTTAPRPTGRLLRTAEGFDLVLTRTFRAPADDVWASITEPERTALWFGPWQGDAEPGRTIRVQLAFEEGTPWTEMRIEQCEAPTLLAVTAEDDAGRWSLELRLSETQGTTELHFVQHLTGREGIGEIGPGWEYYLDNLAAARAARPAPAFEDYYPAQKAYFDGLEPTS